MTDRSPAPSSGNALRRALIGALSAGAIALAFGAATPYPGVTVDSGEYLAVADGLAGGHGYTMPYVNYDEPFRVVSEGERVPMTQFPPLYPTLIGASTKTTGLSLLPAARLIGALAFGAAVAAAMALVSRSSDRTIPLIIAGALMMEPDVLTPNAMVWSEAVMIPALLGAVYFTVAHLESEKRVHLVACGLCCAAASMTRYAGISVILAATVALVLARRPRCAALLLALSSLPLAAWLVRNKLSAGVVSEKKIGWHLPTDDHLIQATETMGSWLVPGTKGTAVFITGLLVAAASLALAVPFLRSVLRLGAESVPRACILFGFVYLILLLASRTIIDRNIPLDPRMLAPLQVLAVVGICAAVAAARSERLVAIGIVSVSVLAAVSVVRGIETARHFSRLLVAGYTGDTWRSSETLRFAGELPDSTLIVTNAPDPLWLWHGDEPLLLPPQVNLYSGEPNHRYKDQLAELRSATACRDGLVVFFDKPTRRPRRFIDPAIVSALDLTRSHRFDDGETYEIGPPPDGCD